MGLRLTLGQNCGVRGLAPQAARGAHDQREYCSTRAQSVRLPSSNLRALWRAPGGGFAFLILVYIVGVLAAIAIPAYQDYTIRAKLNAVVIEAQPAREALAAYYLSNHRIPDSLETAGLAPHLADGSPLSLDPKGMSLTVKTKRGELVFVPSETHGQIRWTCTNGEGLKPAQLPASCRAPNR